MLDLQALSIHFTILKLRCVTKLSITDVRFTSFKHTFYNIKAQMCYLSITDIRFTSFKHYTFYNIKAQMCYFSITDVRFTRFKHTFYNIN